MKLQAFLLFAAIALVSAKFEVRKHEDAIKAHEECHEEYPVPEEIFEQYLNYDFPEHKRTNCYVRCFVTKMGFFHDRNGFDEKAIIKQFTYQDHKDLATVQHGLEKCIDHNESESDVCVFANRVFSCWLKINRHVVRRVYGERK